MMRLFQTVLLVCLALTGALNPADAQPSAPGVAVDEIRGRSEKHYRSGLSLFESGDREQALIEFQLAHELFPSNDIVFMMAQCEYHLGKLREARGHYEHYLKNDPNGAVADTARVRITAIERRPGVLFVATDPDAVKVVIEGNGTRVEGDAPNEFQVPRGRYRITITKENYQSITRDVSVDTAETRQLFFKLQPVPARLTIRTIPDKAVLFVRGVRAENPYVQDVEPGEYEIYAEATDHVARRERIRVEAGEVTDVEFRLEYVQRSGRPELMAFWTAMAGVAGAGAIAAKLQPDNLADVTSATNSLLLGAAVASGATGALVANALLPDYIPDNQALFRIGAVWTGAVEGAALGLAVDARAKGAWIGGVAGLTTGAIAGAYFDGYAPKYGRAALLQSATGAGILAGMLAVPAFCIGGNSEGGHCTFSDGIARGQALTVFGGLNLGLGAGLAMAYLPDQSQYGLHWQSVLLMNVGGLAGAFTGAVTAALINCEADPEHCGGGWAKGPVTARLALVGGVLGVGAGWFLTRGYERRLNEGAVAPARPSVFSPSISPPVPSVVPVTDAAGMSRLVPGLMAGGTF
ncbi:MAG: PEGA domain-containing protein [Deltaproteobacteria bacterium]|nr:PEGA domain-containing protein [Deltaproteobacteria bacterium]